MIWPRWIVVARNDVVGRKVWAVLMLIGVTALMLYQVHFNIKLYLSQPTTFSITLEPNPNFRLPPISICPYPVFEPVKLKNLGVDVSGNFTQVRENLLSLKGLPGNYTTRRLWREAHWELGQVIDSVIYDSSPPVMYKDNTKTDNDWHLSYSPMGPCHTLHPPPGVTAVEVNIDKFPYIKPCYLTNYTVSLLYLKSCEDITKECTNTTCGFEEYIFRYTSNFENAFVYFHVTPVDLPVGSASEDDILRYSSRLYDGNHILKKLNTIPAIISHLQLVKTDMNKGSCVSRETYSFEQCFYGHSTSHFADNGKSSCSPVSPFTMNLTHQEGCSTPKELLSFYEDQLSFSHQCLQKCRRIQWNHVFTQRYTSFLTASYEAKTTSMKKVIEFETYPIAQLFSDIGGSMGLFLGISLLYFWEGCIWLFLRVRQKVCAKNKDTSHHVATLLRYSGILIFSVAACTHILETINTYLTQPMFTAVRLQSSHIPDSGDITVPIARRLASHTLSCRPQEADRVKCQVDCLLEKAMADGTRVIPFLDVDGLPFCGNVQLSIPRLEYIIPSQLFMSSVLSENVEICNATCFDKLDNLNVTEKEKAISQIKVTKEYYLFNSLKLLCNLGGIVGLYLGYSITDAVDFFFYIKSFYSITQSTKSPEKQSSRRLRIFKILILVGGISLILCQLQTFLLHHQVTTSVNAKSNDSQILPLVLTVCRWPPFSFDHLSNHLQINASERLWRKLPKEARLPKILQIMEEFPGNWSGSLEDLWEQSAWNISNVMKGFMMYNNNETFTGAFCDNEVFCLGFWTPVKTQMNRCFALNLTQNNSELLKVILLFPESVEKVDILGREPQIYFTVNAYGQPPLMNKMIEKNYQERITASLHLATYHSINHVQEGNESHSICIHKCIAHGIGDLFNCRLPYATWRPDLHLCNQSQYASIPGYFKGLYGIGQDGVTLKNDESISAGTREIYDKCYFKCNHLQKTFIAFSKKTAYDYYPLLTLHLEDLKAIKILQDEDRHTIAQFLSDIGGIAGIAFGISLSFVLKDLLPKAFGKISMENGRSLNAFQ